MREKREGYLFAGKSTLDIIGVNENTAVMKYSPTRTR